MTYAEYLRKNGANEAEVAVLATPTSERIFAAQQVELTKSNAAVTAYKNWFDSEAVPAYKKMESELIATKASEARNRTALLALQERGLLKLADIGFDPGTPAAPPVVPPADPRYATVDLLKSVAEREGEAIAQAYDIGAEHAILFPGKPLNMRELRRDAVSRNITVEQAWEEKFGVSAARDARATKTQADHDEAIRKEAYDKARQEFADTYGNPGARPPVSSNSPFAPRPTTGRDKQPWEAGDRSVDRVSRATRLVVERQSAGFYGGMPPRPN
jgi:hypothetical protein